MGLTTVQRYFAACGQLQTCQDLDFTVVLTNIVFDYKWQQQTQHVATDLGHALDTHLKALQQQLNRH